MAQNNKRMPVVSLTIFFLILLSTGLSGYYVWQGFLHGFDKYLPILCSCLLMDGLGVFALVFKVSFETRRRAMVPFIASLSLLVVCSIHLAALANMRVGVISQDEQDTRTKTLDDDRHARNVKDARELVELNCAECSPERKRRMYQSEMNRIEKAEASNKSITQVIDLLENRSWGRRYVEDYATAVQLIFGLLAGLAMLINNFIRLYADEPDEFPNELEVKTRQRARRENFAPKSDRGTTVVHFGDSFDRKAARRKLLDHLGIVSSYNPGKWFKADLVEGGVHIRMCARVNTIEETIADTRQSDKLLMAVDQPDFRERLVEELRHQGFEI
jgi:hypothetical protein